VKEEKERRAVWLNSIKLLMLTPCYKSFQQLWPYS